MKSFLIKLVIALSSISYSGMAQIIYTFAGTGSAGFFGDGGTAINAQFMNPEGIVIDASGNMYICDYFNQRIRKIDPSGIISTFAGTGVAGYGGDGGSATLALVKNVSDVAVDATGNVYIADKGNSRVRKINNSGIISTFAGNGTGGYSGDGGPATSAALSPNNITIDALGNVYISDASNACIRKVNSSGVISTIAGTGIQGYSGDGGLAINAQLKNPGGLCVDGSGNIYVSDGNNCIRKINTSGIISTYAGNGAAGFSGDGGAATSAQFNVPLGIAIDGLGNLYISDFSNNRIRKVSSSGVISTFAGNGIAAFSGDGALATTAGVWNPQGICVDVTGNVYSSNSNRIRVICNSACITSVNSIPENNNKLNVFPNPNNGTFKVEIEKETSDNYIVLYNSLGCKVFEQKLIKGENILRTTNLANGLYNYTLLQSEQIISNGKIVVE